MNAKKNKNKKANKQPNPTPPQKEETEKIQEKNEGELSDRADIISDIVAETETETPKKPKRNRGKKKKQDRESDDQIEDKTPEPIKVIDNKSESHDADVNINVIESNPNSAPAPIGDIPNPLAEPIKDETEIQTTENIMKTDPFECEAKHSKKKNKKKKRHDSDKSDKSGDALLCTAAFQKLLDASDEIPTEETEEQEEKLMEDKLLAVTADEKGFDIVADNNQNMITPETEKHEDETPEVQKCEGKKKKNKKDKKHPPKTEDIEAPKSAEPVCNTKMLVENIQDQTQNVNIQNQDTESQKDISDLLLKENIVSEAKSENLFDEVTKISNVQLLEDVDIIPKDEANLETSKPDKESPKPKAKIAKPVEKKRKGKQDLTEVFIKDNICPVSEILIPEQPSVELITTVIKTPDISDIIQKNFIPVNIPECKESLEPTHQLITDICTFIAVKDETNLDTTIMQELSTLTEAPKHTDDVMSERSEIKPTAQPVAEEQKHTDNKAGKKKRKPLKMPIPSPVVVEHVKSLEEMTTELIKEGREEIGDVESIFETLVPTDIEVKATDEKLDEILELKVESHEDTENISPKTADLPEEQWTKPKRRGRKSLKMPPTPGVRDEQFNLNTESKYEPAKEAEVRVQQSPIETLEIRSVKADDSECSPCDVTPDIVYPRSTSQLNIDNNNNTVIREISLPDTLNIPAGLTTPLIQGSGETPVGTPVMVSSFNITEIESPTEKTDLKSKVIEVNQDMEELRLSIERSLAELTALEKSEQEAEKLYEETHKIETDLTTSEKGISKQEDNKIINKESIDVQINPEYIPPAAEEKVKEIKGVAPLAVQEDDKDLEIPKDSIENQTKKDNLEKPPEKTQCSEPPPICPARRDNKGKGKKRKGKQEANQPTSTQTYTEPSQNKKEEKTEQKTETKAQSKEETKQKDAEIMPSNKDVNSSGPITDVDYDPIENFEDALGSSPDDVEVNKTFEMILSEVTDSNQKELASNKPDINITAPEEDFREGKVPQPKNLLGHPNIPVSSNKDDFKKEKHKKLNTKQAKVKIKDANDIERTKESKYSQTESKKVSKDFLMKNCNENGDFIYKYSFRKVFLQNTCHVCAKELSSVRVPCNFCNLLFYCSIKHKDEDWPQHQALCFAISTIVHLKDQKHIYAEAKNITGQNYRLLRMQMILSCEKVLKRRLVPWEQEALLYPRICADVRCREWRLTRLKDCEGCGQISYCANSVDHLPLSHQRWCKSYALYQKLVTYQQTKGRLEPKLPTKVMSGDYQIPEKINEVLASMYEEEIDMNDIQYAALTQIATAPLTVAYSHQLYRKVSKPTNGMFKKTSFVIHVLGAELQFEADVLNKWEVFFLHLRPDVTELVVVLISSNLNPGNLPLELLGKIRLCDNCQQNKRRVIFSFQDKLTYQEYRTSDDFIYPDIVCAFNASINRSSYYPKDQWPGIISSVMRLRSPFLITSHTPTELHRDLIKVKECGEVKVIVEPQRNSFASVRPDRNFITDDETPLLFKNQCFVVLCGV